MSKSLINSVQFDFVLKYYNLKAFEALKSTFAFFLYKWFQEVMIISAGFVTASPHWLPAYTMKGLPQFACRIASDTNGPIGLTGNVCGKKLFVAEKEKKCIRAIKTQFLHRDQYQRGREREREWEIKRERKREIKEY